ncbi:polysaccharide pyruvyl transferase family protein [Aliiglaciecola sp. 2_MG-2023]|uniref:polysaccharide pyruvyl transferase family protein n=1 Tax=unclassified Aliiglaciecola TaxID=2593648 RepID=UPI0026E3BE8E|nr:MULTISPECIES: polysaccharide pyruvyl transferase family protein [unclassified Aliiglaciecola]MDO6709192.1 polysaccharide pyruvyl transferase family protein [Aliiglaciecola sp. 2_MG-2023]MDO6750340.1 polysaccharide pyruvyl transferase family protein [Aliiglaciecola sp. 1_MG-2023]
MSNLENHKNIHFLSASDRINYGDLLFPLVSKAMFESLSSAEFKNYGLVKSDLSAFGAMPTDSYKVLQQDLTKHEGNLVLGGGEMFFPSWQKLYAYINPLYAKINKPYKIMKIEERLNIARKMLSYGKVDLPFTPDIEKFGNGKSALFFNSVGGVLPPEESSRYLEVVKTALGKAKHVSVRDNRSKSYMDRIGIDSTLVPDSALIMSDLFPITELEKKLSLDLHELPKSYAFIQFAIDKSPKDLKTFVEKLEITLSRLGITGLLCPIGISANHEDQVALAELKSYSKNFVMVEPKNLYDIMYLIARSEVYMGTSLHGMITAYSFNTRFIPLNTKVTKLMSYCDTWTKTFCAGCTDFEDVDNVEGLYNNWDFDASKLALGEQKQKVYDNYNKMVSNFIA